MKSERTDMSCADGYQNHTSWFSFQGTCVAHQKVLVEWGPLDREEKQSHKSSLIHQHTKGGRANPREQRRQCLSGKRSQGRSAMSHWKTSLETSGSRDKAWEHQKPRPRPPSNDHQKTAWMVVVATIRTRGRTPRAKSRWSNEETR